MTRDDGENKSRKVWTFNPKSPLIAPLDNFFGNFFLVLLYSTSCDVDSELIELRDALHEVVDESLPTRQRGVAAMCIARNLTERRGYRRLSDDGPMPWYEYAEELGHIEAYNVHADSILSALNLEVKGLPLPSLISVTNRAERRSAEDLPEAVRKIWKKAVEHVLFATQDGFVDFDDADLASAFDIVMQYLSLHPIPHRGFNADRERVEIENMRAWGPPLLRKILDTRYERDEIGVEVASRKRLQIIAVTLKLDEALSAPVAIAEKKPDADPADESSDEIPKPARIVGGFATIVRGHIPKSNDRDDGPHLKTYEKLKGPLPLARMPSIERLNEIATTLTSEFPWAGEAIDGILAEMIARKRAGSMVLGMMPVLLVGPPGSGKTRLSQRLSDLLDVPNSVISMAGMSDGKVLKGCARGWASARPSRIIECLLYSKKASHLFLLDEVDKASSTYHGDPQEILLDLTESRNAARFADVFLMTECDLSYCLYVMTSNSLERIKPTLLSRLHIAYVPMPEPEHALVIVRGVLEDLSKSWRLPAGEVLMLERDEQQTLIGLSPREMRRAIIRMLSSDSAAQRYVRQ